MPVVSAAACTLCADGSPTTLPDKLINIPGMPALDCKTIEILVPNIFLDESSDECVLTHQLSTLCGCPRPTDSCNLCQDDSSVQNPQSELPSFESFFHGAAPECEVVEAYLHSFSANHSFCNYAQQAAWSTCGCPHVPESYTEEGNIIRNGSDGNETRPEAPAVDFDVLTISFFGASDSSQLTVLFDIMRTSAILSIIGALIVMQDNLRSRGKRKNLYNQIMYIMAFFDIIAAVAISLLDIARPTDDILHSRGERGNNMTCTMQGFAIQLGSMTSLFFNASLSTYYLLVIVHGAPKSRLNRLCKWLVGVPIVLGLAVACASIPFVTTTSFGGCQIHSPTSSYLAELDVHGYTSSWGPFLSLRIVPAFAVLIYSTVALGRVYWRVRKVNRQAQRWLFDDRFSLNTAAPSSSNRQGGSPTGALAKLQREVFWQSALYLGALHLSLLLILCLHLCPSYVYIKYYGLWCLVFFVTPLQGFLNCLVFMRPRLTKLAASISKQRESRECCDCIAWKRRLGDGQPSEEDGAAAETDQPTPLKIWASMVHPSDADPETELVTMNGEESSATATVTPGSSGQQQSTAAVSPNLETRLKEFSMPAQRNRCSVADGEQNVEKGSSSLAGASAV